MSTLTVCAVLSPASLAGCGTSEPAPVATTSSTSPPEGPTDPRSLLSSRAAAAKDRRYVAGYSLSHGGRGTENVTATIATDGSWRVDVTGGALGGTADIAMVGRPDGQYQCVLAGSPTGCVRLAPADGTIASAYDPGVQYPFTAWLDILTDPSVAVTVTATRPLPGSSGSCFAVEPSTVTTDPPIESSAFCYADDGTMTAARASFGTIALTGAPAGAPSTVALPAPVVSRAPLPVGPPRAAPGTSPSRPART